MKDDKKYRRIMLIVSLLALLIRCLWLNGKSGDYLGFLQPWINQIIKLGRFKSLKYNIGDYNVPYVIILTIISYFKNHLYLIKFVSIIFDYICAIYSYKIVYKVTNNKIKSLITYSIILFLPTVIINGSLWGQCDSIYTSFILISIYYLLDKKYNKSFIYLGIAFSFKLQTMFVIPLYILMLFRDKNIKWYYFLIIPLVNIILCLPSILMGRNIIDVLTIYFNQTNTYKDLVLNYPNIYNIISTNEVFSYKYMDIISRIGMLFTCFIYFIIWLYVIVNKVKFNKEKILSILLWSLMIATYFLPRMHERYMFVGDIVSVIWFICYEKKYYIPMLINLISVITYFRFLFEFDFINYNLIAIIYFVVIVCFTKYILEMLVSDKVK